MYRRITSEENNRLRLIRKLSRKKYRDAEGLYVIEGRNLIREALRKGVPIDTVLMADDFDVQEMEADLARLPESSVFVTDRWLFEKTADAENGSGILAVVRKEPVTLDELKEKITSSDNLLVLDRLQDPGNIGTMIRTAVAAGYALVIAVKGTADIYSPKVLRSTAGMIFEMPVLPVADVRELKSVVQTLEKRLVVTDPDGGKPYYQCQLGQGVALVIGNEGNGISEELMQEAEERVTIPMHGEIESLNAAVSAALLMYEAVRTEG